MKKPYKAWKIHPIMQGSKKLFISGPGDIYIDVDYDDVDTQQVRVDIKHAVDILNQEWEP
jgi:hypothetical protein